MEVNAASVSAFQAAQTADAVGTAVLKKAMDVSAQSAQALIEAIPAAPQSGSANLPAHLGQNINTTA